MHCTVCQKELNGKQTKYCSASCKITDWRRDTKRRAVTYKGGKCNRCGYDRCAGALIFHHPGDKSFGISKKGIIRSWTKLTVELDKCELLCLNCHAEEHHIPL